MDHKLSQHVKELLYIAGAACLSLAWLFVYVVHGVPLLWGPYAIVLIDAGPFLLARLLVTMIAAFPLLLVLIVFSKRTITRTKRALTIVTLLAITLVSVAGTGHFLHHMVAMQGLDVSAMNVAAEAGFAGPDDLPSHIKEALALSAKLANEGKAPWLPGQWHQVNWPAIPTSQIALKSPDQEVTSP